MTGMGTTAMAEEATAARAIRVAENFMMMVLE